MDKCFTCGNEYDKSFKVLINSQSFSFDSFECAIQALAPICAHCKCKILGHGVENDGKYYCCAHCARHDGISAIKDRI
jgi:hypothetical protein